MRVITNAGDMIIELYTDRAPLSAEAFLRYVDEGRFERATFYRSVRMDNDRGLPQIAVIQIAPSNFDELPQLTVEHESTARTGILHLNGTVSLGRERPGTGSPGAFFVCIGDQPHLNHGGKRSQDGQGFAAFGRVIVGMDVARSIHGQSTLPDAPNSYLQGQILAEPIGISIARREKQLTEES